MNNNRKFKLEQQTKRRYYLLRLEQGIKAAIRDRRVQYVLLGYIALALFLWFARVPVFGFNANEPLTELKRAGFESLFPIISIAGFVGLIMMFGMPFGSKAIHEDLQRIGFVNSAGETPLLVAEYADKENQQVTVMEFVTNGIPLTEWERQRAKIEAALNVHAVKIKEGENKRRIRLYAVTAGSGLPQRLHWDDRYLSEDSFVIVMGESLLGAVEVNLSQIPHILLGGSTGSGKSVLLKLLLMQCIKKGAEVHIADFKGGVDFSTVWHDRCEIIINEKKLLDTLSTLVDELERRKVLLKQADCPNIDAYNRETGARLPRMIFACDEVAEVLDKTGLDKQSKELVAQIENKLSTIARQGRAFGIHLILATQRPDATILSGQIRNNIDCRVCGRADNVLSQIILDSTAASEQIPKDAQGRFIMHDGTVFQGYWFDEDTAFDDRGWRDG